MAVIGEWLDKANDMLAGRRIEAVEQDGVGSAIVADQFEFRIIDYDVAIILDSQFTANLQRDLDFILRALLGLHTLLTAGGARADYGRAFRHIYDELAGIKVARTSGAPLGLFGGR